MSGAETPSPDQRVGSPATVRVAVDLPGAQGERLYDYLPPERDTLVVGDGVVVPFGSRRAVGIVVGAPGDYVAPDGFQLKRVEARLGESVLIGPLGMQLALRTAEHWCAPPGLTLRSLLPPGLLDKVEAVVRFVGEPSEAERRAGITAEWSPVDRLSGARGRARTALLTLLRTGEREGRIERRWQLSAVSGRVIQEAYACLVPLQERSATAAAQPAPRGARQLELLARLEAAAVTEEPFVRAADLPGGLSAVRRLEALGLVGVELRRRQRRHADRRTSDAQYKAGAPVWSKRQELLLSADLGAGVTLLDGHQDLARVV